MASTNPLRDLQSLGRDIRLIGWSQIPINIERACVIFINTYAYPNNASLYQAILMAKLAKWANCEIYYIYEATKKEFVDTLSHFSKNVLQFCLFYYAGNPISQDLVDAKPALKIMNGTIGPDLIYQTLNEKEENNRILFLIDGVNQADPWDPQKQGLEAPGVLFMAPIPDMSKAHLKQLDLENQSIFLSELKTVLKNEPTITADDVKEKVEKGIKDFGTKLFMSAYPPELSTLGMII